MNLGPTELIIILVIVLLLFGSTKLPKLARSLGQAKKEFEAGTDHDTDDEEAVVERRTVTERPADETKPPTNPA